MMNNKQRVNSAMLSRLMPLQYGTGLIIAILLFTSCRKTEFRSVDSPAYIRVFNDLGYNVSLSNKLEQQPFFCMFIDPEMDASGKPVGGTVVGDFLDKRSPYASPNPAHAGLSTSRFNPEYPGKELVPTGPILNGFDLTNWAQVASGTHRFLFMSRPISDIPFNQLSDDLQHSVFLDTTITLEQGEVYTLQILQRDVDTRETGLYVRQENFHKQAFSDSLSYVNFYNLSAKGFWQSPAIWKKAQPYRVEFMRYGIRDTMNLFLTQLRTDTSSSGTITHKRIPEFSYQFAGALLRNTNPAVAPYYGFPIFVRDTNKIYSQAWQFLQFCAPGIDPANAALFGEPPSTFVYAGLNFMESVYAMAQFDHGQYAAASNNNFLPGMTVNVHAGIYNPRTYGAVSSVEVVNGNIYLTTVQRKYPQPIF